MAAVLVVTNNPLKFILKSLQGKEICENFQAFSSRTALELLDLLFAKGYKKQRG